ncbi:NnrU family protein [Oceaniovalibus guishaninsula JLT2003]|uniref:NnrU family protein n=1 Tax=Oceaniovalibus guishaninsula JLT2003 TaxID=1231392 RepID=K2I9E3_9RHOB|nr:NnrU family protein [Oceaniovalibus guishaninsula]EKE45590.1 NnrU family protein [Oceaniovalibus guishaninsula JLT2003]
MTLLVLGVALWWATHLFKRVAPGARQAMQMRLGNGSKGIFALLLVVSVVLMVLGYRRADFIPVYYPPEWGVHVTDLAMYFAIALFGLGHSKSPLRAKLRHPQLTGFSVWAASHLLVNGDLASLILFGGLLVWALVEIPLINARVTDYVPYSNGTTAGTVRLAVIAAVLYVIIATIHTWLGVWPFPGARP